MGVERSVTRWYLQRQNILGEIHVLATRLDQLPTARTEEQEPEWLEVEQQLANAKAKLHMLGPCPKPMMG